jgi:hypothetical protein
MSQPNSCHSACPELEQARSMLLRLANQAEAGGNARAATILLNTAELLREALPLRARADAACL